MPPPSPCAGDLCGVAPVTLLLDAEKEKCDSKTITRLAHVDFLSAEIVMAILGIRHVGDTICGNESLRGVSGGVSRGEGQATGGGGAC